MLVTHGIGFLPQCDQIVVMVDGRITEIGSYSALVDNNQAFAEFLRNYSNTDKEEGEIPGNGHVTAGHVTGHVTSQVTGHVIAYDWSCDWSGDWSCDWSCDLSGDWSCDLSGDWSCDLSCDWSGD